jgi:hypothetical protein
MAVFRQPTAERNLAIGGSVEVTLDSGTSGQLFTIVGLSTPFMAFTLKALAKINR